MAQLRTNDLSGFPSFSLVVETENLSSAEVEGLIHCLNSLAAQDLSPALANEVLIAESGDVPQGVLEQLCADYPWLTVHRIDAGTDYYEAKMQGFQMTTGEVIILCDSDCTYEPNWLSSLLTPFAENPEIQSVAGETTTPVANPYGLAMALTYIFPRFSNQQSLSETQHYFCNNVAFRRSFLLAHPIPSQLPIYRGNCTIHAHRLTSQGHTIWKQPQARATHASPNGLSHFFWRFLLLGDDAMMVSKLLQDASTATPNFQPIRDLGILTQISIWKAKDILRRTYRVLSEDPRRLLYLPLALPIALVSLMLFLTGLTVAYLRPQYLLTNYSKLEANWGRS